MAACLKETENLCEERVAGYELGVKAAMLRLLFLLLGQCPKPLHPDSLGPESASDSRLKSVLRLIEAEYSQPLSVARAAADCSLSPSHFMRWFKQKTGSSFTAYLNERRLAAAAEMLRRNDDTILSVAEQAGFENLSNFNRQFKARYGVSPRQYRSRTP